jgi:ABC-type transport system involved in cytochrome c biogenesis permease subunit
MEVKYTTQGLLIYLAMTVYLLAFLTSVLHRRKTSGMLFVLGFVVALLCFTYRWFDVHHVPLQNLFEVFLFMGMAVYPISQLCRCFLRVAGQAFDMLIAALVLFPAGFIFSAAPQRLPPALQSWIFTPHVAVYMLSYIFMAKAAFHAACQLTAVAHTDKNLLPPEEATYRMICAGFPLLTLGLILGSLWGQFAWGDYWGWDPKEQWSLASWLVYVGYFHFRYMFGKKYPRANSTWAITGMVVVIVTLLWVNLSALFSGLHSYAT